jgi:hypothetical protein
MDGSLLSPRRIPHRLLVAALVLFAVAVAAPRASADEPFAPAARWPAGGTALHVAYDLAVEHWGFSPCHGKVAVAWAPMSADLNAQSSWTNELDPYRQPSRNQDCDVTLSTRAEWDWPKLCTVVIHELGHLAGHDHVDDPDDVMSLTYLRPAPECAATPEPAEVAPPLAATARTPVPKAKTPARHRRTPHHRTRSARRSR